MMYAKLCRMFIQLYFKFQCTFLFLSLIAFYLKIKYRNYIIIVTPVRMVCVMTGTVHTVRALRSFSNK